MIIKKEMENNHYDDMKNLLKNLKKNIITIRSASQQKIFISH